MKLKRMMVLGLVLVLCMTWVPGLYAEVVRDEGGFGMAADNLLTNGGFETLGGMNNNWQDGIAPAAASFFRSTGSPVFAVDDTMSRSGDRSARISAETVSRGAIVQEARGDQLAAGQTYRISGWMKTEQISNKAILRLQAGRSGSNILINFGELTGTNGWTYFSRELTLPDNITSPAWIKIEAFLENSTGAMWLDDFSIAPIIPLVGLDIQPSYAELDVGQSEQLSVTYIPADTTEHGVTWNSSDEAVVAVSETGEITALQNGYSRITVTSVDGSKARTIIVSVGAPDTLIVENYAGTAADGLLDGQLVAMDSALQPLSYALALEPSNGTVLVRSNGSFSYYAEAGYTGEDTFTYMVAVGDSGPKFGTATITVQAAETKPVLDLLWHATPKDTALTGKLEKVRYPEPATLTWSGVAGPAHGEVSVAGDGSFVYTPEMGYTGYDQFKVSVESVTGTSAQGEVTVFVLPDEEDFLALLGADGGGGLLANASRWADIEQLIGDGDPYMKAWVDDLQALADAVLATEPLPHTSTGANYNVMRDRLIQTSLMYKLSGEERYAARAALELEAIAAYPDWFGRTNNLLPLAELTYGVALAYDWLQAYLTDEQSERIAEAIRVKSLGVALAWYRGEFRHNGEFNNINLVDNGGFALGALAIMDRGGAASTDAAEVLRGAYTKLQQALRFYTEDGSWLEGPAYWHYGGQYFTYMMAAMNNVLGEDYGLSTLPGVAASGEFPVYLLGEGGFFDFYDGGISLNQPESMWYADFYNQPQNAWHLGDLYDRKGVFDPLYLIFYKPGMFDTPPVALDRTFSGIETLSTRSAWDDPNALFAAMKGFNDTLLSHHDLDAGTFVFDALGVRWAMDSGNESYNLPGFWDYNGARWRYYRKTAEGHNTIVVNPQDNPIMQQQHDARALLIDNQIKPRGAYGILDMTERYARDAVSMKRGMMLAADRQELIVRDEMRFKQPSEWYWFMHTRAEIEIIEEGRAAILSSQDKRLYIKLLEAPVGAELSVMAAQPLPTSPNPEGQSMNHGIRKLAVHMEGVERSDLTVWMVPLRGGEPLPQEMPTVGALADWSIPDGELAAPVARPEVQGIAMDGQPLSGFNPKQTYYGVIVPFDQSEIPVVTAVGDYPLSVRQAEGLPGRAVVEVTDPARPGAVQRYTIQFESGPIIGELPAVNKLPIAAVTASAVPEAAQGNTPDKTIDGNLDTRWAAAGQQWIQYDLGESQVVGAVTIAYMFGDTRQYYFDIQGSLNGMDWVDLYRGQSSGMTNEPQLYPVSDTNVRYIRINGQGNSSNNWNSVTEVAIFRPSPLALRVSAPNQVTAGEQAVVSARWSYGDGRRIEATDLTYTSSNTEVAAVDELGRLTGRQAGEVTITVKDETYGLQGEVGVEVVRRSNPPNQPPVPWPPAPHVTGPEAPELPEAPGEPEDQEDQDDNSHEGPPTAGTDEVTFADIRGHWAEAAIAGAVRAGWVSGYPDGSFKPGQHLTRAEFTRMVVDKLGFVGPAAELTFADRGQLGDWAVDAVALAVREGIISGYPDGTFRPAAAITRAEMAVMIASAYQVALNEGLASTFADDASIPAFSRGAVAALQESGVIRGQGGNRFAPAAAATRAEAVMMLLASGEAFE